MEVFVALRESVHVTFEAHGGGDELHLLEHWGFRLRRRQSKLNLGLGVKSAMSISYHFRYDCCLWRVAQRSANIAAFARSSCFVSVRYFAAC